VDARFGDADGPRFVHHELPEYPSAARRLGREGKVVLMITIDEKGKPIRVDVVEATDRRFARSATEALMRSTFLPAKRHGIPVVSRATVPVRFAIEQ
jgi:protein TonB